MAITKVELIHDIDFQRKRINESIDELNAGNSSIATVNTEASLPSISAATANIYLIKNHSTYKGSVLALIVDSAYRFIPITFDPRNSNSFIYITLEQMGTGVSFGKCVYLDASGIWQLADSTNPDKYPIAIVGPNNSIILGDTFYNSALNLTTGTLYYCANDGTLTSDVTPVQMGTAINNHTLNVQITNPADVQKQSDFNETDTESPSYIKNKPTVVSKTAPGYAPQLPDETILTKFLRQDGFWSVPNYPSSFLPMPQINITDSATPYNLSTYNGHYGTTSNNRTYVLPLISNNKVNEIELVLYNNGGIPVTITINPTGTNVLENITDASDSFVVTLDPDAYIYIVASGYTGSTGIWHVAYNTNTSSTQPAPVTNYDYVIETQIPTADNNYTWYRKYKSGWVEQGGFGKGVITLPIEVAHTECFCSATRRSSTGDFKVGIQLDSTTQVRVSLESGTAAYWEVKGPSA